MQSVVLRLSALFMLAAAICISARPVAYQLGSDPSAASTWEPPTAPPPSSALAAASASPTAADLARVEHVLVSTNARIGGHEPAGDEFAADLRASFHPHGQVVCASGCAASNHPTETLSRQRFLALLDEYSTAPSDQTCLALDTLLYFGRQTRLHLADCESAPLDAERRSLLAHELSRNRARVELRLIDQYGRQRAWLPPTAVPLDRRHEFALEVDDLQPLIASGTVKRVGLDYLWTRL